MSLRAKDSVKHLTVITRLFYFFSKERNTMTLTKDVLIEMIRDKVGYPVKEAKEILEMILEEVKLKLEEGKDVKISGFGKWAVREKEQDQVVILTQEKELKFLREEL